MMEKKNKSYVIYNAKNKVTGEYYVGATTNDVESRKKDHLQKANKKVGGLFQEAISTYGAEAFEWTQVDTAHSVNELAEKEKKYILKYNSKKQGYNLDVGGGFQKKVYKYNLKGELIAEFDCLKAAAISVKCTKQHISRAALSVNKEYKGFYWSYNNPFITNKDIRKKEVIQYDLNGGFLAKFNSVSEASKQTGLSKSCIARVCRGEREKSSGFTWQYGI